MELVDVTQRTILDAYEISAAKDHDVYDCFSVAIARQAEAEFHAAST